MSSTADDIGHTAIERRGDPWIRVYLHIAVLGGVDPILDDRDLTVTSLQGHEQVSSPFEFQVALHGNTDRNGATRLRFEDIIGQPVTLGIDRPAAKENESLYTEGRIRRFDRAVRGEDPGRDLSLFNGIATSFSMAEPGVYNLTLRPALHRTTLTNRYCVYSGKSIRDVIETILDRHGIAHDLTRIAAVDNPANARIQDWLQAGESDYEVIHRLMAKAHLYYYFVHDATSHTIVFANDEQYPPVFADDERALHYTATDQQGMDLDQRIEQYDYARSMTTTGVHTTFVRSSEAWEHNGVEPYTAYPSGDRGDLGDLPCHIYKVYAYGAGRPEADGYNDLSWRALQTSATTLSGSSLAPMLRAAHTFELRGADPVRPTLDGRRFVLNSVKHQADAGGRYHNQFEATETPAFLAQFSLQDTQQGTILAEVTGHADTPSDWRFYRKTVFDPETQGFEDRATPHNWTPKGVLVRLATDDREEKEIWVKLSSQMQTVPELGAIVEIARSRDASEIPEIQGISQANGTRTVTPGGWTAHTSVGSSYSASYGDGVSIGFGRNSTADLDRAKKLVLDAYKRQQPSVGPAGTSFGHASYNQGSSYSYSTADEGRDGVLSASESHGSTYSRHSGAVSESESDIDTQKSWSTVHDKAYSESTIGESESHSTIEKNTTSTSTVMGNSTNTSSVLGVQTSNTTVSVNNSVSATGTQNSASVTGSSLGMSTTGVEGHMNTVGVSGGMSMTGASSQMSLTGASSQMSLTGSSDHMSLTGASSGMNLTGESSQTSLTGMSTSMNLTGLSSSMNITGPSSSINVSGPSSSINIAGPSMDIKLTGPGMTIQNNPATMSITVSAEAIKLDMPGLDLTMPVAIAIYL